MAKKKVTRLRPMQKVPAPKRDHLRDVVIEVEGVVSRALSELTVVRMVLIARKRAGDDLDCGEIACIDDVLKQAQVDMINIEWPLGLDYSGSLLHEEAPAPKAEVA
jgi:hypothetical protein